MSEPALVVITNSDAGTSDEESLDSALTVLRESREVEVFETSSPDDLDDVVPKIGDRWIIVAGGDGSLHAVVAALQRADALTGTTIGLIPLGTGNDFARTLGIPLEPDAAAHQVVSEKPRSMDLLIDDEGTIVVNNVHLGAGADAGRRGHRWKKRLGSIGVGKVNLGKLGYPIGAALTAFNPPTLRVRVEIDGKVVNDVDERVLMVVLGNGASVGGGTEIAPDADPTDGRIDVLVATPVGVLPRLKYAASLPFANHPEHEDVVTYRGREVTVSGSEFWTSADGELKGPMRRRSWRLLPQAYSIVAPPQPAPTTTD